MVQEERRDLARRCRIGKDRLGSNTEGKGPAGIFPSEKDVKQVMVNLKLKA